MNTKESEDIFAFEHDYCEEFNIFFHKFKNMPYKYKLYHEPSYVHEFLEGIVKLISYENEEKPNEVIHPEYYIPELVFENLLARTSNDTKDMILAGIYNLGDDTKNKKNPIMTQGKVEITFLPDYARLDMNSLNPEFYNLLKQELVCTKRRNLVTLNGVKIYELRLMKLKKRRGGCIMQ